MADVVCFVSGHGFGHATRIRALVCALRARAGDGLAIEVRTRAPARIFTASDPHVRVTPVDVDAGVLQPNGLDIDFEGTLGAHEAFARDFDERVARESATLRADGTRLVVGDVPPLAFAAAQAAGLPSFGVTNFGWDWIASGFPDPTHRWQRLAAQYAEAYGRASGLFRLPLHGDLSAFPSIVDAPLLVNRSRRERGEVRRALGLDGEKRRLVLVSFGGHDAARVRAEPGDPSLRDYLFVGVGARPAGFPGAWHALPKPLPFPHEDLMRACDALLGKPGYGSVAEAIAHDTLFLHLPRAGFREVAALEAGLARFARARQMPREDFEAGHWRAHLDALFEIGAPFERLPCDGDTFIADALLRRLPEPG